MTGLPNFEPYVGAGTVSISDGVARITDRSGGELLVTARSVRDLDRLRGRIDRALDRYARGEQNVIED